MKLTCVILEAFHFPVVDLAMSYSEAKRRGLLDKDSDTDGKEPATLPEDDDAQSSVAAPATVSPEVVTRTMRYNALPMLRALLTKRLDNQAIELRSSIAIALVKLISVMGPKTTAAHLTEIVIKVCIEIIAQRELPLLTGMTDYRRLLMS